MISLETLQHSTFAPLVGQTFILKAGAGAELTLHQATVLGHRRATAQRDPFSLAFRGPQGLFLPQGTYSFSHSALGELEFFITQSGNGPQGSEFEAVFN